jgi:hypothetical protein
MTPEAVVDLNVGAVAPAIQRTMHPPTANAQPHPMPPLFTDLLLQILRSDPDLPTLDSLVALTPEQWQELTASLIRYRGGFQMLEFVRKDPQRLALVPQACLDQLTDYVRKALMRNLGQQAHLRKMLVACQAEGICARLGSWVQSPCCCG